MSNQQRFSGEWETKQLGELFIIFSGSTKNQYIQQSGRYFLIDMGSVGKNGQLIRTKKTNYDGDFLQEGDLIMPKVDIGGGNIIGKVAYIDANDMYVLADNVYALRLLRGCPKFFSYLINRYETNNSIRSRVGGSAQLALPLKSVEIQDVPVPSQEEQRAIAEVLSDVDGLINALDALIAKKRAIKQATMQQLLTGKTRLPGFSGVWETKRLGEIADCLDNVRVPLNETQRATMPGPYPYCGANGVLDYVNDYVLDDDVILIAEDGGYFDEFLTRPIAYQMSGKIWVNNHAHILKAKSGYNQDFLYYSLVHKNIMPYLLGGTRAKLNKFEMYKIEINVPNDIAEQSAIAAVLSDMDAEIAALEQRREKTIAIKQGMMQQLLTGKVRLFESENLTENSNWRSLK